MPSPVDPRASVRRASVRRASVRRASVRRAALAGVVRAVGRGVLATAIGAAVARGQPAATAGGYDYVFRVAQETADERGRTRREPAFIVRARARGEAVRVDFLPGSEGTNTPGDWYVTRDGGRTMTLVDERRRAHHVVDVAAVREAVGDDKGLAVAVGELSTQVQPEGDCGTVAGWPTRCVTVERRYVVRTRYWALRSETRVVERARLWLAPGLPDFAPPLGTFFLTRTDLLVRRDSAFVAGEREAAREIARVLGPAGVLRTEVTHVETTDRARATTTRVIEVVRLRRAAHDERLFEVPAGYRLVRR